MGCSLSCRRRCDEGIEETTMKNSLARPKVQATVSPFSSVREKHTDRVRSKQQRGNSTHSPVSSTELTDSKGTLHSTAALGHSSSGYGDDSNPSLASFHEITDSKGNQSRIAAEDSSSGYGGNSTQSLISYYELTDINDNQHRTAAIEHSSSGYGGSEVSLRSCDSARDVSNLNYCLKTDAIHKRLSSILSCSSEGDVRSSFEVSTTIHVQQQRKENGYSRHKSKLKLPHRGYLQRNFRYIKKELTDTVYVVDHLIQEGDLNEDDYDEIKMAGCRMKRVDLLLRKLLTSTPAAYDHFQESLRQIGRQDMVDVLSDDNVRITELVPVYHNDGLRKEEILRAKENVLIRELKPGSILDFFYQNGTFSLDDYEAVYVKKTRKRQAKKLIKLIRNKLPWGYYDLLYALWMTQTYHIIEELLLPYQGVERLNTADGCSIDNYEIKIEVHLSTTNGQRLPELEMRLNEYLNDSEGAVVMEFLLERGKCGFLGANMGSVIIRLRPYSTTSVKAIQEFCRSGRIRTFIMKILRAKKLLSYLPKGGINVDFKVEGFDQDGMELEELKEDVGEKKRQQTDAVEIVRRNRSYLLEEVDIFRVVKASLEKKIFTNSDIKEIQKCAGTGRLKMTMKYLDCLLQKGPLGCNHFLEVLKETNQLTILQHLNGNDANSVSDQLCAMKDNLADHLQTVADEIDPMDFEEVFIEKEILAKGYFLNLREKFSRNRRSRAIYFIKTILDLGAGALMAFVDGLVQEGHDQIVKMLRDTRIKESNHNLEENNLEANFEIEEISVEETIAKVAIFAGRIQVIINPDPNQAVENNVTEQTDVTSTDEVSSKGKDNNDDEETEVSDKLTEYHHKKKKHLRNNGGNRRNAMSSKTCADANDTAGPDPTHEIYRSSTLPKHRKETANIEAYSQLTLGDSGYMGSQSSEQNLP